MTNGISKIHKALIVIALLLMPAGARAQFFTAGDDPGCRRWYSIESENYRIIYPRGLDSLARVYAREMERFRKPVGLTSGYVPGEDARGKMPVVLHAYNAVSNGSVAWAPKRMDAYTLPQVYDAEATPWAVQLAVHESRHISQMLQHQPGKEGEQICHCPLFYTRNKLFYTLYFRPFAGQISADQKK